MAKQQVLKEQRNYLYQPRVMNEFDTDFRGDISFEGEVSLTKQSEAEACDVNNIVKRYTETGILPGADREALYGDFSAAPDFREALEIVAQAQSQFMALSADVRARFQNDPAQFLEFVDDPKNSEELVKLGLATAKPQKEATEPLAPPKAQASKKKSETQPPPQEIAND